MIQINIQEAKTNLSRYLRRLEEGERVIICRRNVPIAELRPIEPRRLEPRPVGLGSGEFEVPASFFEPLPNDLLDAFEGGK